MNDIRNEGNSNGSKHVCWGRGFWPFSLEYILSEMHKSIILSLSQITPPLSFPENDLCGLCRVLCLRILPRAETVKWGLFSGVKHEETPVRSSVESYIAFALQSKL